MAVKEGSVAETLPAEATTQKAESVKLEAEEPAKATEGFYIDLRPKIVSLPEATERKTINIRYPLMPPFAFAHIHWDDNLKELLYTIEEPLLNDAEKELLSLIELGLEEMINISFIKVTGSKRLLEYLESNVQSILKELGTTVSKETYNKLMYYIYRNSVGLNNIEPMLRDYYIEDIECNGIKFPVYIVHRKYGNLKTNILYADSGELTDFVEKLAQKAGRYVSYAKPILDGTLLDGSRVNATYTEDVTTRGPTFTIRKFTAEPWTPIHLMSFGSVNAEMLAYFWLAIEHKFNIMIIGETSSGKTTFLNAIATFVPPEARIVSIEDTRELNLTHVNWLPAVTRTGFGMPNILGKQFGEITLFDLLRETFRQNPDYVILGETRGEETYVLFQGMASGHPSFATFHAASVATMVKRLETPPISLPASLVESLDVVCVVTNIKEPERTRRRVKEIVEIKAVSQELGNVESNKVYEWNAVDDTFNAVNKPIIFDKLSKRTGITLAKINDELKIRTKIIQKLMEQKIMDFKEFAKIMNEYYKDNAGIRARFGI